MSNSAPPEPVAASVRRSWHRFLEQNEPLRAELSVGSGPPVVIVVGAFNDRSSGAALAALLAKRFTVYTIDRRGRGASGDTSPYAVAREIEDLRAIVDVAGGAGVCAYGISSGGLLVLEAAAAGVPLARVAVYEAPLIVEGRSKPPPDLRARVLELVAAGDRGGAAELFLTALVEIPAPVVGNMRRVPFWHGLEALAHTLPYDLALVGDFSLPAERFRKIGAPALLIDGENSPPWMRATTAAIAAALQRGEHRTLPGQTHDVKPDVLAPVLIEHFAR